MLNVPETNSMNPLFDEIARHEPYVRRVARRHVPDVLVDDLVQDTMVRAFAHPETYDPDRGKVHQWLWWLCFAVRSYNVRRARSKERGAGWKRVPLVDEENEEFRLGVDSGMTLPPQEVLLLLDRAVTALRDFPREADAVRVQVTDGHFAGPKRHSGRYHLRKARDRLLRVVGPID